MCREVNDAMYELQRRFPERLLTLAHVPIGEEGALEELERSATLGVAGVYSIVHVSRKGWSLDNPGLNSFYELVSELDLPIITHPAC
jgi:predicted TIM-barrel fold metal-dependent hydrolase